MDKKATVYQMYLVKPYQKNGKTEYSRTYIGMAFKKVGSNTVDLKLDLFPIMIPGAYIRLDKMEGV